MNNDLAKAKVKKRSYGLKAQTSSPDARARANDKIAPKAKAGPQASKDRRARTNFAAERLAQEINDKAKRAPAIKVKTTGGGPLGAVSDIVHTVYGHGEGKGKGHGAQASIGGLSATNAVSRRAIATGLAAAHDPIGVSAKTAAGLRDAALATPGGIINAVTHPLKTVKDTGHDYGKRYSGSLKDQIADIRKHGAAPEVLDALGVTAGTGSIVGRALSKAATAGAFGEHAAEIASAARPKLRVTGGTATPQRVSPNYFKAVAQRKLDKARATKDAKAANAAKLGDQRQPALRVMAAKGKDEVSPYFDSSARRIQRKTDARAKSRGVAVHRGQLARDVGRAQRVINRLNPHERKALYYVGSGIIPNDPVRAVPELHKLREDIVAHRAGEGLQPVGAFKKTDQLKDIDHLIKHADQAFTPRLGVTHEHLRQLDLKLGAADPGLTTEQRLLRRHAQQAERLGIRRGEAGPLYDPNEGTAAFINRVQAAAKDAGLEKPLYFPSEKYADAAHHADYALGGHQAMKTDFRYTGQLFRSGMQNTRPEVLLRGMARSIKRKHNWKLVRDRFNTHAFEGLRDLKPNQLRHALAEHNINMDDVAFWSPGLYDVHMRSAPARAAAELPANTDLLPAEVHRDMVERADNVDRGSIASALKDAATTSLVDVAKHPNRNWSVIPRAAYDEIHAGLSPDRRLQKVGRMWDIQKEKQSRVLLGLGNLPWLQFQVLSNAGLAGLATKGAAWDVVRAQKWYRSLGPDDRAVVDSITGDGMGYEHGFQTRIGAAVDNHLVRSYQNFKNAGIWDKGPSVAGHQATLRKANPINLMFKADEKQNAFFRRTVLYNKARREAFDRMGKDVKRSMSAQDRLFKTDPNGAVTKLVRDPQALDELGKAVDDWLGDYTSYTHLERKTLRRYVMFYGFLRHSLRLLFYTMPVKHPIMTAIMGKLGQLNADEIKDLLGAGADFSLGTVYIGNKKVDLARANPAINSLVGIRKPSQAFGVLPPSVNMAVDQLTHSSNFKGADWAVHGHSSKSSMNTPGIYDLGTHARVALDDALSLAAPYRIAKDIKLTGPQGDDSLLFSPRPTHYGKKTRAGKVLNKNVAKANAFEKSTDTIFHNLFPLVPVPQRDAQAAQDRKAYDKAKKPGKRKAKAHYFGGSSHSGPFTGTSSKGGYFK